MGYRPIVRRVGADMQAFLDAYRGMAILPIAAGYVTFAGLFEFSASVPGGQKVTDAYQWRIELPQYPERLPRVFETGGRIPRNMDEHTFSDGMLCLGSELRLRLAIGPRFNLLTFAERCVVPYLYAVSRRVSEGRFVLGELAHGTQGLFVDYQDIFAVTTDRAVIDVLRALCTKPTSADRHPCPCGCGKRLAQCGYSCRVAELRRLAPRSVFQAIERTLGGSVRSAGR